MNETRNRCIICAIFITTLLALNNFVIFFEINGNSMQPEFSNGSKVLCRRNLFKQKNLVKNTCIIFHFDNTIILCQDKLQDIDDALNSSQELFVKRIVGVPNDEIVINKNQLYINSVYICDCNIEVSDKEYIIPNNKYFVLGDNFSNSLDSRYYGLVDSKNIDYILY